MSFVADLFPSQSNLASLLRGLNNGMDNDDDSLDGESSSTDDDYHHNSTTTIDLSDTNIEAIPMRYTTDDYNPTRIRRLILARNRIVTLPGCDISVFTNLTSLDVSNNSLALLPDAVCRLPRLRVLIARNNLLDDTALPKSLHHLDRLETLNLSGNRLTEVPTGIVDLPRLKALYLGANLIEVLPFSIGGAHQLEVLYLGGNLLREVPATIGRLSRLSSLALCDNRLETIPPTIAELQALKSLSLHNNLLRTLPTEIVKLRNLKQLSLRNNPLVHQFVRDMAFNPPTLRELSARGVTMRVSHELSTAVLPVCLIDYMNTANQCVNPKCKGVYFEACVEHIKFVDFCGKYRVPLLQYLCSPRCSARVPYTDATDNSSSESDTASSSDEAAAAAAGPSSKMRLKKVLLG